MTTRASSLVAGLLVLLGSASFPGTLLADRCTCTDLVLPYFEVQLVEEGANPYDKQTTLFSVGNCGEESMTVQLTVWSNWALPIVHTEVEVGTKAVEPFNLRDWLMFGQLPDRQLTAEELAHVQAALCGEPSPVNGLYYGTAVAPKLAVGFITVEPSHSHRPAGSDLWGDFFSVDPSRDFAAGESLVRMVGNPSREMCERHLLRFLETGEVERVGGIGTELIFWTGFGGAPSPTPEERFTRQVATCQVYDQSGLELGTWELPLLATQAIPVLELGWPTQFGWVDCVTPTSTFTCMHFSAEGRYTMTLRSFCEEAEAEPPVPREVARLRLEKATEGSDADRPPGPELVVGDPVEWTYEVTNIGEAPLTGVTVMDDQGVVVTCPKSTLEPGESMTCTGNGIAVAGQYANLATVTATGPEAVEVTASDPSHYFGEEEPPPGDEGCTPGYWKNHEASWAATGYTTSQTVVRVFTQASAYPTLAAATLIEGLDLAGGPGAEGAAEILMRAAVAALLNAASPALSHPLTEAQVISQVDAALAGGDRDTMLVLAAELDWGNNLGCPL